MSSSAWSFASSDLAACLAPGSKSWLSVFHFWRITRASIRTPRSSGVSLLQRSDCSKRSTISWALITRIWSGLAPSSCSRTRSERAKRSKDSPVVTRVFFSLRSGLRASTALPSSSAETAPTMPARPREASPPRKACHLPAASVSCSGEASAPGEGRLDFSAV